VSNPDLTRRVESPLADALSNLDREAIQKDIDAGQWKAASREEVVRAANASLKGTGLAFLLPIGDLEHLTEALFKYTVSGSLKHKCGESVHCHLSVTGPLVAPRMQTQADGAAYTYAAKNCIINTLSLPRGGNEQTEMAHMEDNSHGKTTTKRPLTRSRQGRS
jgi:hypothetical protein